MFISQTLPTFYFDGYFFLDTITQYLPFPALVNNKALISRN